MKFLWMHRVWKPLTVLPAEVMGTPKGVAMIEEGSPFKILLPYKRIFFHTFFKNLFEPLFWSLKCVSPHSFLWRWFFFRFNQYSTMDWWTLLRSARVYIFAQSTKYVHERFSPNFPLEPFLVTFHNSSVLAVSFRNTFDEWSCKCVLS